jgi:DNA-binding NarL/FixJ family response regulator
MAELEEILLRPSSERATGRSDQVSAANFRPYTHEQEAASTDTEHTPQWTDLVSVGVAGRYSNRSGLLEQLRKVAMIVSDGGQSVGTGVKVTTESVVRSRRLRDRFSSEDLQIMIDLYRSGTTAKQVAEKFGVSLRSVRRLLHKHDVHRHPGCP